MQRQFFLFILVLILGIYSAKADSVTVKNNTNLFAVNNPTELLGELHAGTTIDVLEYVESAHMYRVQYKNSAHQQTVIGLCRPEDLGMTAPASAAESSPVTKVESTKPAEVKTSETTQSNEAEKVRTEATANLTPTILSQVAKFDPAVWSLEPESFLQANKGLGFDWAKYEQNKIARSIKDLNFLGFNIPESSVHFKNGMLQTIVLYLGKGKPDEPAFDEKTFNDYYAKIVPVLDQWSGFKGVDAWVKPLRGFSKRKSWFKYPLRVDLEWGSRQDPMEVKNRNIQIEFFRFHITRFDGTSSIVALTSEAFQKKDEKAVPLQSLLSNIQRDSNGDVFIRDIPMNEMVDNDYSVTSTGDRLLRYYELSMDPEELQKAATEGKDNDVSPEDMYHTLKKLADRFGLFSKELQESDWHYMFEQTKQYNIVAKANKLPSVGLPKKTTKLNSLFSHYVAFFLKQVRLADRTDIMRFEKQVEDHIEKGAPVCWLVYLSWSEEKNPPGAMKRPPGNGAHLRLIIGYNKVTKEILFSDPWGAGHEMKRMGLDDAYFITNGLFSVLPSS